MTDFSAILDWATEVELEQDAASNLLPLPHVVYENDLKIVTEYRLNEEGNRVKTVRTFRIEKRMVSKSVALRKTWAKFGDAANDKPGPNPANTIVSEKIDMQFISSLEEDNMMEEDDGLNNLKTLGSKNIVKCRKCGGDHWTSKCPLKDTILANEKAKEEPTGTTHTKYVPPNMRVGAKKVMSQSSFGPMDEKVQIKIMNLSEATTEEDLHDLVRPFGLIHKTHLAKDKQRDVCRGYGFVTFKSHQDAAKAIRVLNKFRYDHLILAAEWAKPKER